METSRIEGFRQEEDVKEEPFCPRKTLQPEFKKTEDDVVMEEDPSEPITNHSPAQDS